MKISILCSDKDHPINPWVNRWIGDNRGRCEIDLVRDVEELRGGDLLFLISCHQIVNSSHRSKYSSTLVVHASDLPKGRGWSPYIWDLLEGADCITVSLLEAEDGVDTGAIWAKRTFEVKNHQLIDEINSELFETELMLMSEALLLFGSQHTPEKQDESKATYYRRRTPADSEIDPEDSLRTSFNKIRLMDWKRYPAFFYMNGFKYSIKLVKE
ncbi:formyltransferase family protein [Kushneria indalinina]|uniref:Methionyl-tRNA formyltransferase n=1 Tax=Kushneria indalinina DSM 14324 TaxID=1122140 RepID=A0A3D9DV99_9GAMM|nr:formyltransferase family protein [Kushneria indalinina]REC94284.1 methionyl-tRNA formyltransferase [Kushneria indalinina DSM 14324]